MTESWEKVSFAHNFTTEPPAFLATIQSVNNENGLPTGSSRPWFTVRSSACVAEIVANHGAQLITSVVVGCCTSTEVAVNSVNPADAWVSGLEQ